MGRQSKWAEVLSGRGVRFAALCIVALSALGAPGCPMLSGPSVEEITVNEIPAYMNGSTTARCQAGTPGHHDDDYDRVYRLMTPQWGFTINLTFNTSLIKPGPGSLIVTSERPLGEGAWPAGENLGSLFHIGAGSASWTVPQDMAFPPGPNLLRASLAGAASEVAYRFDVYPMDDDLDPFETRERWLFLFDRDDWSTTWRREGRFGEVVIESVEEPNGIPDFDEAMAIIGFRSSESGEGASTVTRDGLVGTNAILRQMIMEEIRAKVRAFYHVAPDGSLTPDSVNIDFLLETDDGAPEPGDFLPEGDFSMIAIGGDHDYWFGMADLDWNNRVQNALVRADRGLFVTNLLRMVINTPIAWAALGPFLPGAGTPVGESNLDALILSEEFVDSKCGDIPARMRHRQLARALELTARAIAAGTAHEIGHSLGLVADGFPSHGLFGGEQAAEFAGPRTNPSHIDTAGNNIMAAGVHGQTSGRMIDLSPFAFNAMNLAYLRGRLIYCGEFEPGPFDESPCIDLSPEEQHATLQSGIMTVMYPLTVTNPQDETITARLDLDFAAPISAGVHAELDRTTVDIQPHGAETVTVTFTREPHTPSNAYEVEVTGQPEGLGLGDRAAVIAFVP